MPKRLRLTNLPSVISGLPRTPGGARTALARYEKANADLPPAIRRLMGLSALGKYFGRKVLEAAVEQKLPQMPFRDWSWRWWNALNLSGLGWTWAGFVAHTKKGGTRAGATYIREHSSSKKYLLFLKRLGVNPHNAHRPSRDIIWTKGGCWRIESPMTQLLVLKKHLSPRMKPLAWQKRFGDKKVYQLESELMRLINPDTMLSYEAKQTAFEYARRRIAQLQGWTKRKASHGAVAWFFNQPVPAPFGRVVPDRSTGYVLRSKDKSGHRYWEW